ncbi:MAG: hypothetical protein ACK4RK_14210 [Gemmataceae bacterium]
MRWPNSFWLVCLLLPPLLGCRSSPCEQVEAELRVKELEVEHLRDQLSRCQCYSDALIRELQTVQQHNSSAKVFTPPLSHVCGVKEIVLGRQTGAYRNPRTGVEVLQVVVEPKDADGHAIKVPGELRVEALEILPGGVKAPLSAWSLNVEQLRQSWKEGILATGYILLLPWQKQPTTQKLRIVAQLKLLDGRLFEADKDITLRHLPHPPAAIPVVPIAPTPVPHDLEFPLPMPTPVEVPVTPVAAPAQPIIWKTKEPLTQSIQLLKPRAKAD